MTPAIFPVAYGEDVYGAILNQDFTVNSPSNPARCGEVVMLYLTGGGMLTPQPVDGEIVSGPEFPRLAGEIKVAFSGGPRAEPLYAGAAPGFVAGAIQVNAQIPEDLQYLDEYSVVVSGKEFPEYPETFTRTVRIAIE